jgi:hypothetical protein
MKKIVVFFFLIVFVLVGTFVYSLTPGISNIGKETQPYPSILIIRGGGLNVCSDVTGTDTCGSKAPGMLCLERSLSEDMPPELFQKVPLSF